MALGCLAPKFGTARLKLKFADRGAVAHRNQNSSKNRVWTPTREELLVDGRNRPTGQGLFELPHCNHSIRRRERGSPDATNEGPRTVTLRPGVTSRIGRSSSSRA